MDNNQLTHHGILGMKWGVRRTPAQLGHDTPAKKKRKKPGNVFTRGKIKRQRLKNLEKARVAKKEKEEYEAGKKKAIESGTAADVLKYKGKLTNMELQTAVNRLNMEAQLSQINQKTVKTGMDKAESFFSKVDRVKGMTEKGIAAYNTVAKIYNSLNENGIPTLDGNYKNQREEREKSARDKEIKKLIETGSIKAVAKKWNTLSVDQRKAFNARFVTDRTFQRYLDEATNVPMPASSSEPASNKSAKSSRKAARSSSSRYHVTAGQEIVRELLKEFH